MIIASFSLFLGDCDDTRHDTCCDKRGKASAHSLEKRGRIGPMDWPMVVVTFLVQDASSAKRGQLVIATLTWSMMLLVSRGLRPNWEASLSQCARVSWRPSPRMFVECSPPGP